MCAIAAINIIESVLRNFNYTSTITVCIGSDVNFYENFQFSIFLISQIHGYQVNKLRLTYIFTLKMT